MKNLFMMAVLACTIAACCNNPKEKTMTKESQVYIMGDENPIIDVKPGITRQIMGYNDDLMLVKVMFDSTMVGRRPQPHTHPHTQVSYIISGKFEVQVGESLKVLGPGDSFYAAPNVPHESYCLEPGTIIDTFSPMRETFVK